MTPAKAFPFSVTPDEAKKAMASTASLLCNEFGFRSTFLAALFPSFNSLQPVRFSAAYFPAWIVNAEIEVDITYGDEQVKPCTVSLSINAVDISVAAKGDAH